MLPFPHVMYLLSHKFAGLCASRLSFARIFPSPIHSLFLWHTNLRSQINSAPVENESSACCSLVGGSL